MSDDAAREQAWETFLRTDRAIGRGVSQLSAFEGHCYDAGFAAGREAERAETARLRAALERVMEYGDRQAVGIAEAALAESEG